jgi:hypothetical protein
MGGTCGFGRNRESRSREAAGRRNWPEAVPRKMHGRKRAGLLKSADNRHDGQDRARRAARITLRNPENDAVYLPLKKGSNELMLAVSELGGGWGFICRVAEMEK